MVRHRGSKGNDRACLEALCGFLLIRQGMKGAPSVRTGDHGVSVVLADVIAISGLIILSAAVVDDAIAVRQTNDHIIVVMSLITAAVIT